jgi:hypothetical protein
VTQKHTGRASASFRSTAKAAKGFGAFGQVASATPYLGKRLRMSAYVRSEAMEGRGALWFRVDTPRGETLDTMGNRPITTDLDWMRYDLVLDVEPDAFEIAFGATLQGGGSLWVDDVTLTVVDANVAATPTSRETPRNLDFEASGPPPGAPPSWSYSGSTADYVATTDESVAHAGRGSGSIRSIAPHVDGAVELAQDIAPGGLLWPYARRRVRLSAFVRTEGVTDGAFLWIRCDSSATSAGRNTRSWEKRSDTVTGTHGWEPIDVTVLLPSDLRRLTFGAALTGGGTIWIDDVAFVALRVDGVSSELSAPTNLDFEHELDAHDLRSHYSPRSPRVSLPRR